jgi:hypothetical protein
LSLVIEEENPENISSIMPTSSCKSLSKEKICTTKPKQNTRKDLKLKKNDSTYKLEKYLR